LVIYLLDAGARKREQHHQLYAASKDAINARRREIYAQKRPLLTVNFRQPSYEFTFNVGIDLLF
jgi:hypothetical protein